MGDPLRAYPEQQRTDGWPPRLDSTPVGANQRAGLAVAETSIPGLAGGALHRTALELHQRHDDTAGTCNCCGAPRPCPVRHHAAWVIAACGQQPCRSEPAPRSGLAAYEGWALTGRSRPLPVAGFIYDRS